MAKSSEGKGEVDYFIPRPKSASNQALIFSHCLSPKSKVPKKGKTEKRTSNSTFPHPSLCGRNGDYLAYIFDSALLG